MTELSEHATAMADPFNREPSENDCLFGIPIVVREGGGEPHLERGCEPLAMSHTG